MISWSCWINFAWCSWKLKIYMSTKSYRNNQQDATVYLNLLFQCLSVTVFELLMMSGVLFETCWAIDKHWNNTFLVYGCNFARDFVCETWSLTFRRERRLRVFENRGLRKVFRPKRDEVRGEWRKLHNEELNDLYSLPNIVRVVKSRRIRWAGHVARMGEDRVVHRMLVGKPEWKRPLGRPRRRWKDNIKMDLQEVGGGLGDWIELAQDRDRWRAFVGTVRDFRVPQMRGISWLTAKFTG
jgi:hypothetical protein